MQQQYTTYRVLFFLHLLILPILLKAQPTPLGIDIENNWEVAKAKAAEQGKFIFVDFTASYCGACKRMEQEVFTNPEIIDLFNEYFIFLRVIIDDSIDTMVNGALLQDIHPQILPTMVFYRPVPVFVGNNSYKTAYIQSCSEFKPVDKFLVMLKTVIQNNGNITADITVAPENKQTPIITPPPINSNDALAENETTQTDTYTQTDGTSYKGGAAVPKPAPSQKEIPAYTPPPTTTSSAPADKTKVLTKSRLISEEETKLDELGKKINGGQYDNDDLKIYSYLAKANYQRYQETADWYLAKTDDVLSNENRQFILDFANTTNCRAMTLLVDNISIFKEKNSKKVNERISETLRNSVRNAPNTEKEQILAQALAIAEKAKLPNTKLLTFELKGMCYQGTQNWQEYSKLCKKYITEYKVSDYKLLNDIADVYAQNVTDPKLLQDALIWAEKSVRIEPHYYNYQTCAMLCLQLGDQERAKEYANHAIELVPTEVEATETAIEIANIKQKLSELF